MAVIPVELAGRSYEVQVAPGLLADIGTHAAPFLRKLGVGRLPGDFNFRLFGREWSIPLASTVVLSLLASLIIRLL